MNSIQICRRLPAIIANLQNRVLGIYAAQDLLESTTKMAAFITTCSLVLARLQLSGHQIGWIISANTQILNLFDTRLEQFGIMSERRATSATNLGNDPEWEMIRAITDNLKELEMMHSEKLYLQHLKKSFLKNSRKWLQEIMWFAMEILEPTPNGHTVPSSPDTNPQHIAGLMSMYENEISYWAGQMRTYEHHYLGEGKQSGENLRCLSEPKANAAGGRRNPPSLQRKARKANFRIGLNQSFYGDPQEPERLYGQEVSGNTGTSADSSTWTSSQESQ